MASIQGGLLLALDAALTYLGAFAPGTGHT